VNHYEQTESLAGHDFGKLDFAIEWYENKHTELEKLYE